MPLKCWLLAIWPLESLVPHAAEIMGLIECVGGVSLSLFLFPSPPLLLPPNRDKSAQRFLLNHTQG